MVGLPECETRGVAIFCVFCGVVLNESFVLVHLHDNNSPLHLSLLLLLRTMADINQGDWAPSEFGAAGVGPLPFVLQVEKHEVLLPGHFSDELHQSTLLRVLFVHHHPFLPPHHPLGYHWLPYLNCRYLSSQRTNIDGATIFTVQLDAAACRGLLGLAQ